MSPDRRQFIDKCRRVTSWRLAFGCLMALVLGGCAVWRQDEAEAPSELPPPRMSPDAVALEVAFLRVDDGSADDDLWSAIDELQLEPPLRRRLAANGVRCGVVGAQLPLPLQQLLQELEKSSGAEADVEARNIRRRIHARAGKRNEVLASHKIEELPLLLSDDAGVSGGRYEQAVCVLALVADPQPSGNVRLTITPEIHHGKSKTEWVGQDGMFRLQAGQEKHALESLRIDAVMAIGETLILSSTPQPCGLGRHFFCGKPGRSNEQCFLLVRLVQTQLDDLFAPPAGNEPLTTRSL